MMTATKCPTKHQLKELSLGRLDAEQSDELLVHIDSCDDCQSNIETIDDSEDSLITSLRTPGELDKFQSETNCERAMAKALGVLADGDAEWLSDDLPDNLPRQFGEYEIVRPLGRGGMGSVYLARHNKLGREVALKVLAHHRMGDLRMRQRFESEMQALGRLSHPNIVTAHDAREVAGNAVLVTEYIDGFDLGQLLQRTGPLSVANACEIIRQVAVALEYASGQGFVHRDVKPSNIMVSRSGEVKLLDLGLARLLVSDTEQPEMTGTGQAMGSADYIAPEQVADSRMVDVRADIYSLGCTLFKLLTGVAPFSGEIYNTAFAKMTAHVSTPAPSLAEYLPAAPKELVALVDTMLAKSPADRPQTPREIAAQLPAFSQGKFGEPALVSLIEQAILVDPSTIPKVGTASSPLTSKKTLKPAPFFRRRVPIGLLIAAGLAGLAIGFFSGVIVTIKYPDGTIVKHIVPDGGEVEIVSNEPNDAQASRRLSSSTDVNEKPFDVFQLSSMPVFFGILSEKERQMVTTAVKANGAPVYEDDDGIWLRVDDRVNVNTMKHRKGSDNYAYLKKDADSIIPWSQLQGHLGTTSSSRGLALHFDDDLFLRIQRLTKANLNRHLAIVVNGKVIATPMIVSPILRGAQLTGKFSREDIQFLNQALNGLVEMPQDEDVIGEPTNVTEAHEADELKANALASEADPGGGGGEPDLLKKTEGIWQVTFGVDSGHSVFEENNYILMAFKDGRHYLVEDHKVTSSGTYYAASSEGNISQFFVNLTNERTGFTRPAIFGFERSGELKLCINENGDEFPNAFESKPDSPNDVLVRMRRLSRDVPLNSQVIQDLNESSIDPLLVEVIEIINAAVTNELTKKKETIPGNDHSSANPENASRMVAARNNMKRFPLGFINHASETGTFPASAGFALIPWAPQVNRHVSWRVAILPYIEQEDLFKQYNLSEPWDSESNLKLLEKMPEFYRSPFAPEDQKPGYTNYQGFFGETTALGETEGVAIADIQDGVSATVLIVDSKASVPWTKPTDLHFEKPEDAKQAIPHDNQSLMIAMADGTVRSIAADDWETLAKLITRSGGEEVNVDEPK